MSWHVSNTIGACSLAVTCVVRVNERARGCGSVPFADARSWLLLYLSGLFTRNVQKRHMHLAHRAFQQAIVQAHTAKSRDVAPSIRLRSQPSDQPARGFDAGAPQPMRLRRLGRAPERPNGRLRHDPRSRSGEEGGYGSREGSSHVRRVNEHQQYVC
jgi:hypothetical protein